MTSAQTNRMNIRYTDKRQRILDATMELIAENGLHNTPMSQVSKHSGVSAGAIYHHFPSKEVLINQLYLLEKQRVMDATFGELDNTLDYRQQFYQLLELTYGYFIRYPQKLSLMEQCANSPLISEDTLKAKLNYEQIAAQFILRGIEQGQLKDLNLALLMSLLFSQIVALVKLPSVGQPVTEQLKQQAFDCCWDSVSA